MKKLKLTLASFAFGVLLMAAPITALACSGSITIIDNDTGTRTDCYLVGEDSQYCYYECYAT